MVDVVVLWRDAVWERQMLSILAASTLFHDHICP